MSDGTLKISPLESKRPATPATHTISYVLDGFPVTTQLETTAPIGEVIARLKAIGAVAPSSSKPEPTKAAGAPLCPVHNTPMAPSTKRPGTFYCKSSVGQAEDGRTLYCTKKA